VDEAPWARCCGSAGRWTAGRWRSSWPPPGCVRSSRSRSQGGWATASGCSLARERVRRLAWLARGEDAPQRLARSLKASSFRPRSTPQAMVTSLVGMVFTPACALALKVANAPRAAAAVCRPGAGQRRPGRHRPPSRRPRWHSEVGIVVFADAEHVQGPRCRPARRSRRCRSATATARSGAVDDGGCAEVPQQLRLRLGAGGAGDRRGGGELHHLDAHPAGGPNP
jgi:hypothetical protein